MSTLWLYQGGLYKTAGGAWPCCCEGVEEPVTCGDCEMPGSYEIDGFGFTGYCALVNNQRVTKDDSVSCGWIKLFPKTLQYQSTCTHPTKPDQVVDVFINARVGFNMVETTPNNYNVLAGAYINWTLEVEGGEIDPDPLYDCSPSFPSAGEDSVTYTEDIYAETCASLESQLIDLELTRVFDPGANRCGDTTPATIHIRA